MRIGWRARQAPSPAGAGERPTGGLVDGVWSSDEPDQYPLSRAVLVASGILVLLAVLMYWGPELVDHVRWFAAAAWVMLLGALIGWSWSGRRERDFTVVSAAFVTSLFLPWLVWLVQRGIEAIT